MLILFKTIFNANSLNFPYAIHSFDICYNYPEIWFYSKFIYKFLFLFICIYLFYHISLRIFKIKPKTHESVNIEKSSLHLLVGNFTDNKSKIFIPEKGLFQNILVTGTIGSGKTSSVLYPFVNQLVSYNSCSYGNLGMLILDVKGNFCKYVKSTASKFNRTEDLIVIEIGNNLTYNPLDKPNLTPIVLANRLKTILTLFSSNNSDSYWLDKAEQVLTECIKLCRLYNDGYVTFLEIHKLINYSDYYKEKISKLRSVFLSGKLAQSDIYNLKTSLEFFENEFNSLDSRVLSILKSEITRITGLFISDYNVQKTFCPSKGNITFSGFDEVISDGKIVVLNMNIAEYKNLSKVIAAYLKLDFQTEVLAQLSKTKSIKPCVFICDEFHEYVTSTDADFFAQSRESKCINIVATQSYTSLLNTLKENSTLKVIIQNLVNKIWLRTDDLFTIEDIQKQIGKKEKIKISHNISENAKETRYSYITNSFISRDSNISESLNKYTSLDYIYDTNFFSQRLQTFHCLAFLSDGNRIFSTCELELYPYFKSNTHNKVLKRKSQTSII